MPILDGPTPDEIQEEEANRQESLNRARRILGTYYLILPFLLVYLLFKIFPPSPWGDWASLPISFLSRRIQIWTSLEERLILLVVAAGALGSYIHSATSYSDYLGNRQFVPSWLLWYLLRPLVGVCLALIVYFAMRGGLLSMVVSGEAASDAKQINPFGIAAITGLTGMFSKQAADKLAEVFSTLFRSQGDEQRRDSLAPAPPPEIKKIDPNEGPSGGGTPVTITGTGFLEEAKVTFGDNGATNIIVLSATTITVETPGGEGVVDVTVINSDGQKVIVVKGYTYLPPPDADGAMALDAEATEAQATAPEATDNAVVDEGDPAAPDESGESGPSLAEGESTETGPSTSGG